MYDLPEIIPLLTKGKKMKQLDVVVSPPTFVWDPYMTFDPDQCDL